MSTTTASPRPPAAAAATGAAPPVWLRPALLVLATTGLVLPWVWNLRYFQAGGSVLPQVFWPDAMANALTTAITLDVYLAATSFALWVLAERRVRRPWLHVLACFGLGLAFALPLYLAWRLPQAPRATPAPPISR